MNSTLVEGEENSPLSSFNWEKAKNFYYVAKSGSFTKAAHYLKMSQSALSRSVLELESSLGVALFIREARGVKLTRKGEELFSLVEGMFLGANNFTRKIHAETHKGKKRKIRIATSHAITSYILDRHIFEYNEVYPNLVFELISEDHLLDIDIILNDVDIIIRPYDPWARDVQQEILFTLEKRLFASEKYIEKYGEPQTIEELKDHRLIAAAYPETLPYADMKWILRLGLPEGELHEPIFTTTSLESTIEAAKYGIGIISCYQEMRITQSATLKNILPYVIGEEIKVYFIYPSYLANDEQILDFKKYLQMKLNNIDEYKK